MPSAFAPFSRLSLKLVHYVVITTGVQGNFAKDRMRLLAIFSAGPRDLSEVATAHDHHVCRPMYGPI